MVEGSIALPKALLQTRIIKIASHPYFPIMNPFRFGWTAFVHPDPQSCARGFNVMGEKKCKEKRGVCLNQEMAPYRDLSSEECRSLARDLDRLSRQLRACAECRQPSCSVCHGRWEAN